MILIGLHHSIYPTHFTRVKDLESLHTFHTHAHTMRDQPSLSNHAIQIAWFDLCDDKDFSLCSYARDNALDFALRVRNVAEFLSGAYFLPKYALIDSTPKSYQALADTYILDTKVLYIIDTINQIEECASQGLDGVVFAHVLESTANLDNKSGHKSSKHQQASI